MYTRPFIVIQKSLNHSDLYDNASIMDHIQERNEYTFCV